MQQSRESNDRITIGISADALSCVVTIAPAPAAPEPAEITAALMDKGIDRGRIDHDAVEGLCDAASASPQETHSRAVARGIPATDGENASFMLDPQLASRFDAIAGRHASSTPEPTPEPAAESSETSDAPAAIDFRAQSAFVIVNKGDSLGAVRPATANRSGINVRGEVIPGRAANSTPFAPHPTIGVRDGSVVALVGGVLRYGPGLLAVEPELEIPGDADFRTGNIDFPGNVSIRGGVKDHFRVHAGGTLNVAGLIEAADIRCDRDVHFAHGMAGREIGTVWTGGDLHAGYLDGVTGQVEGSCIVLREIKECHLRIVRGLDSPTCSIFGGEISAEGGVDAGTIGSPAGIRTIISVAPPDRIGTLSVRMMGVLATIQRRGDRNKDEREALRARRASLTPAQSQRLAQLDSEQSAARELANRVGVASGRLLDAAQRWAPSCIRVHKAIHRGSILRLRHIELQITQSIVGSASFELDHSGEPRCYLNGSSQPVAIKSVASVHSGTDPYQTLRQIFGEVA